MRLSLLAEQILALALTHPITTGATGALIAGLTSWLLTRSRDAA